ncbi:MAG TPA: DinB family protein [Dehalococcoidia bacterium]|nr:DinB family protein [Dehalococcoidia bacterium]
MVSEDVIARVTSYIRHQAGKGPAAVAGIVADSQGRLLAAMEAVAEPTTTRVPAPGEWCVRELLRHVIDAENGVATTVERLAVGTPISLDARRAVGMKKDDDGRPYAQMLDELRAANQRLQDVIAALPPEPDMVLRAPHPFFGDLNCIEWAAFQKVHDEDHIQHTAKILAAVAG